MWIYILTIIVCVIGIGIAMYALHIESMKFGYMKGVKDSISNNYTPQEDSYIVTVTSTYADAFTIKATDSEDAIKKTIERIHNGTLELPESTRLSSRIECAGNKVLITN